MAACRNERCVIWVSLSLMLGCLGTPGFAQTVTDCVSDEVIAALLSAEYRGVPGITPGGMTEELEELIPLPEGSTVVASASSETWARVAVLVSSEPNQARDLILSALLTSVWQLPEEETLVERGFVSPERDSNSLCGPENRMLRFAVYPQDDHSLAVLDVHWDEDRWPCNPERQRRERAAFETEVSLHLPILQLPEGSDQIGGGGSGNGPGWELGDSHHRSIVFTAATTGIALVSDFGSQLMEQGWTLDAESSGTVSEVQIFQQEFPDGLRLVGFLTVVDLRDNKYEASIRVLRASSPVGE